jgi:hypothetical protein
MKITAFWDIVPSSLVEVDRRFRGVYCLHHQGNDRPCHNSGGLSPFSRRGSGFLPTAVNVGFVVDNVALIALMTEAVRASQTSVNFYQTTRSNIPEQSHLRWVSFRRIRSLSVTTERKYVDNYETNTR